MRREMFLNLLSHTTNQVYLNYISPSLVTMLVSITNEMCCFDMLWEDGDMRMCLPSVTFGFIASKTFWIH